MENSSQKTAPRRKPRKISGGRVGKKHVWHIGAEGRVEKEAREEERRKKDVRALELKKQGHTYKTIADQMGISPTGAHLAVRRALQDITLPEAELLLTLELERLEGLYAISYGALAKSVQASNGEDPHLGAMDRCLSIMRQKAAMLGLTDRNGNVNVVLGDQNTNVNIDQSEQNVIIAAGSKDDYIAALQAARERVGGEALGKPEVMHELPSPEVIDVQAVEEEDDET